MILRTLYAIQKTWILRRQMKRYLIDANLQMHNVASITPQYLLSNNIKALALDFDGVLAAHGEPQPRPEILEWLRALIKDYAPHQIYILSNKPTPIRAEFFRQDFPQVVFVIAPRKKPYPDGLQEIMKLSGLPSSQIMLVDDRLGTGILATAIVGAQGLWITKPYVNLKFRPLAEIGFIILRWLERVVVAFLPA